jgi:hypothetical protein
MVKCSDCGFLALRDLETRELVETEHYFRERGNEPPRAYTAPIEQTIRRCTDVFCQRYPDPYPNTQLCR